MELIKGGFKEGNWQSDRTAYSDEEITAVNERLRQIIDRYPHHRPLLELFLWDIRPKAELKRIK